MNNAILNLILQMQLDLQYHHDVSHISKVADHRWKNLNI